MTRPRNHDGTGLRIIPSDNRGYKGLTAKKIDDKRELVVCGTEAEAMAALEGRHV